jgi:hypothetical protein
MLDHIMAGARPFAFATQLTRSAAGAAGRVSFVADAVADQPCPTLEEFAVALSERRSLRWSGAGGAWAIEFS